MQADLFSEPEKDFELFDAMRIRVIFRRRLSAEKAAEMNHYFQKSKSGHLSFRPAQSRIYKIK